MSRSKKPVPAAEAKSDAKRLAQHLSKLVAKDASGWAHWRRGLPDFIAAGEEAIAMKPLVKKLYGPRQWERWLEGNCPVALRSVREYMNLARNRETLSHKNGNLLPFSTSPKRWSTSETPP